MRDRIFVWGEGHMIARPRAGRRRRTSTIVVGLMMLVAAAACSHEPASELVDDPAFRTGTTGAFGSVTENPDGSPTNDGLPPEEGGPGDSASEDPGDSSPAGPTRSRPPSTPAPTLPATSAPNLVKNPSFEDDGTVVSVPQNWHTDSPRGSRDGASFVGSFGGGHEGRFHLTHWDRRGGFDVATAQSVTGLATGRYVSWLWVKAGRPISVATLTVSGTGGADIVIDVSRASGWHLVTSDPFPVSSGTATLTLHTVGGANGWVYPDDVHLHLAA
jgi:hypothetical protein